MKLQSTVFEVSFRVTIRVRRSQHDQSFMVYIHWESLLREASVMKKMPQ